MAEVPRAIIRKEDFESFRRTLGAQLPDTYDEWQYLTDSENLKFAASGHAVKGKEIDPQDFIAWCTERGDCTLHGLHTFAGVQAARSPERQSLGHRL